MRKLYFHITKQRPIESTAGLAGLQESKQRRPSSFFKKVGLKENFYTFFLFSIIAFMPIWVGAQRLHVEGNQFVDGNNNPILLRGVSINDVKYNITDDNNRGLSFVIDKVTDNGNGWYSNVVRVPVHPSSWLQNGSFSQSKADDHYNTYLKPTIDYLTQKGVYSIIDWHYIDDPRNLTSQTDAFWQYIAPKFSSNGKVLYEIFNEPDVNETHGLNWSTWKSLAVRWLGIIRQSAPATVVLINAPHYSQHLRQAAFDPINDNNIAYVAHIYPEFYGRQGGNLTQELEYEVKPVSDKYPVIVTEWGWDEDKSGTEVYGNQNNFGNELKQFINNHGISFTSWVADDTYFPTIFDSNWNERPGPRYHGAFTRDWIEESIGSSNPTPPGDGTLQNGSFSNGLTGWSFISHNSTASAAVSNGEAVISISSAGSNVYEPQLVQDGLALVNGQTYTVSFQARAASSRNINLYINTGPSNYAAFFDQTVALTTSLQNFSYTFVANQDDSNARIDFNCGGNNANVIIDNVSLVIGEASSVAVSGVSLSPTSASLEVGTTQQLSATVSPSNATNKNVNWSSSNTSVATVNSSGLVTAVAAGSATITATTQDGNKTATSAITVTAAPSTGSEIKIRASSTDGQANLDVLVNNTVVHTWSNVPTTMTVLSYSHPSEITNVGSIRIRFTNDANINGVDRNARVDYMNLDGTLYQSEASTTYSTGSWRSSDACAGGYKQSEILHCNGYFQYAAGTTNVAVTGVSVSPTSASLTVGGTRQLSATVSPSNATNKNVSWSSSSSSVATVSSSGLVTAVAAGTATITVTTADGSKTATSAITVTAPPAAANNIIKNHSFENDLADWAHTSGTAAIDLNNAQSGSKALRVGATNWTWVEQNLSGWTAGSSYTFSAWGKAAASGNSIRVAIKTSAGELHQFNFTSTSYSQQTATVTIPSGATWAQVYVTNRTTGSGYADNIVLSSTSGSTQAMAQISDFEKLEVRAAVDDLNLYPNPTSGQLEVEYTSSKDQNAIIRLYDRRGIIVTQQKFTAMEGENAYTLEVSGLIPGQYILQIEGEKSKKAMTRSIIIKK